MAPKKKSSKDKALPVIPPDAPIDEEGRPLNSLGHPLLARDGSLRGVANRGKPRKRKTALEQAQEEIEKRYGIKNFRPSAMLAVFAMELAEGERMFDDRGQPVIDEKTGEQARRPPDLRSAATILNMTQRTMERSLAPLTKAEEDAEDDSFVLDRRRRTIGEVLAKLSPPKVKKETRDGN